MKGKNKNTKGRRQERNSKNIENGEKPTEINTRT